MIEELLFLFFRQTIVTAASDLVKYAVDFFLCGLLACVVVPVGIAVSAFRSLAVTVVLAGLPLAFHGREYTFGIEDAVAVLIGMVPPVADEQPSEDHTAEMGQMGNVVARRA